MVQRSDLKLAIYDPNKPSHQSEHVQYSYFVVIQQKPYWLIHYVQFQSSVLNYLKKYIETFQNFDLTTMFMLHFYDIKIMPSLWNVCLSLINEGWYYFVQLIHKASKPVWFGDGLKKKPN